MVVWWPLVLLIRRAAQRLAAGAGESRSPHAAEVEVVVVVSQWLGPPKWRRYSRGINSHYGCGSFRYPPTKKMRAGRNRLARIITA